MLKFLLSIVLIMPILVEAKFDPNPCLHQVRTYPEKKIVILNFTGVHSIKKINDNRNWFIKLFSKKQISNLCDLDNCFSVLEEDKVLKQWQEYCVSLNP